MYFFYYEFIEILDTIFLKSVEWSIYYTSDECPIRVFKHSFVCKFQIRIV